ncbi:MAG: DUF4838 domain-containing protein [Lentisphaeria bacterium]
MLELTGQVVVMADQQSAERCYRYAVAELSRLLGRIGVATEIQAGPATPGRFSVRIAPRKSRHASAADAPADGRGGDGFRLSVDAHGVTVAARSAKGVLNGVYELAERLGFLFLLPGEKGEWAPARAQPLPLGEETMRPRFARQGVFASLETARDFSVEEWLRFYAKLRFNAVAHRIEDRGLAEELGLRLEVGEHGLSALLPRARFEQEPELFRMFQPEDFNGRRTNDSNFCVTNPKARQIVKRNYRETLRQNAGAYAVHAWADDLPAGGWCNCPSCRAFSPSDQAMLAMRLLAETLREEGAAGRRIPVIAYHDTMYPGRNIRPTPECFLLFAPRERCYAHALDDASCPRNAFYLKALEAWQTAFNGIGDAHTFEYYFDQVLCRGMYPFLPGVILGDLRVYQSHGIGTHFSLQVAGPAIAPEFNMLLFARALWHEELTSENFIGWLAPKLCPENPAPWQQYLCRRAAVFAEAMRFCDHATGNSLDYRWLPETDTPFGKEMARAYATASRDLAQAAADLAARKNDMPGRAAVLADTEVRRALFESSELLVMHHQQSAMNHLGRFFATDDKHAERQGVCGMERTLEALSVAHEKALAFGLPEEGWYNRNINGWQAREYKAKLARHRV